ncbi:META domain-containing protein [Corynebacterium halotolerans]|uniref:DUF306 domain-containing protein n=1 Tax=Corynebacterium halotolerans YIM 70093 = DSM 44683 TaxID=1121362 RepID=M1N0B4_9CORY|nr:META domain-containing protein [Corynebacterium halotolerans]AGF73404.1 hypothetical protein A605_12040 [Corynebacterium halotolerans YIM 70093 = DSM 44683]
MTTPRRRALAALSAALLATAPVLSACGDRETAVAGSTWQITGLWTTPEDPGMLPDAAAGRAQLIFGEATVTGSTGCAPIQGTVSFTRGGDPSRAREADAVTFEAVEIEVPDDSCQGTVRSVHEDLTDLLAPETAYDLRHESEVELVLTRQGELVDRPVIRLSAV